jgi:Zn-finger nucleic acid-binding protein
LRLIACSQCHAQYDVSQVVVDAFDCRCGERLENKTRPAVDATIERCGSCGAHVPTAATDCEYCGAAIVRDPGALSLICPECFARNAEDARFCAACGVTFQPQAVEVDGREWPCPDCTALMPASQVAGVALNECRTCQGLWVPGENFDLLVSRAAETRRQALADANGAAEAPRVSGANPYHQRVKYRKCPVCDGHMHRRNYQKSSGVILDVCHEHGTWLDADELEQIAGFILSGGKTSTTFVDEERKCAEAAAVRAAARLQVQQRYPSRTMGHGREPDLVSGLVDVLTKIFS